MKHVIIINSIHKDVHSFINVLAEHIALTDKMIKHVIFNYDHALHTKYDDESYDIMFVHINDVHNIHTIKQHYSTKCKHIVTVNVTSNNIDCNEFSYDIVINLQHLNNETNKINYFYDIIPTIKEQILTYKS
jgi:hypothetical protein